MIKEPFVTISEFADANALRDQKRTWEADLGRMRRPAHASARAGQTMERQALPNDVSST